MNAATLRTSGRSICSEPISLASIQLAYDARLPRTTKAPNATAAITAVKSIEAIEADLARA
ncbi:MAG: hypothetical protein KDA61_12930 [Planctomycetales bacterium]|nr:hypothetical protein [Planctomycetales bacterium]